MSDLQCPATVLLVPSESLASSDSLKAFAGRRLAGLFVDPTVTASADARAAAERLASAFDCRVEGLPALNDSEALDRAVEELADLYRGEAIAVVAPAAAIQARLERAHPPTAPIELAVDSDGWVVCLELGC